MSALLMGLVWGIELSPPEQIIMLALADHGKDDGTDIYPSIRTLAWKTNKTERQVQRILRTLERKRLIIAEAHARGGRGHATRYTMHLTNGVAKLPLEPLKGDIQGIDTLKGDIQGLKGDIQGHPEAQRVTSRALKGDIQGLKGDIAMSPEPYEPSYEPENISSTVVVVPARATAAVWDETSLTQTAEQIAQRLKFPVFKRDMLHDVLIQYPAAPEYLKAQAVRCWEHYTDPRHRKTITVGLFDEWMQRAEARRLQLQQGDAHEQPQQQPGTTSAPPAAPHGHRKETERSLSGEERAAAIWTNVFARVTTTEREGASPVHPVPGDE